MISGHVVSLLTVVTTTIGKPYPAPLLVGPFIAYRIPHVLCDASLSEHAQWITMHCERSLVQGKTFRMSR